MGDHRWFGNLLEWSEAIKAVKEHMGGKEAETQGKATASITEAGL